MIPIPFSRGVFIFGPPLWVPRHLSESDMDIYRERLDHLLTEVTHHADILVQ